MKKIITLALTAAMLMSVVLFTVPANAAAANIDYVEAYYFTSAPTIDGYITEAEWGKATVHVDSDDAATVDDSKPFKNFFYWQPNVNPDDQDARLSYDLWLRWDENYFYIGAKVLDVDGHSLKNGTTDTWNGDALQTRIDYEGPNAVCYGATFDATKYSDGKPWGSPSVPDFIFGYTQIAGGFCEAWENTSNRGMTAYSKNPLGTTLVAVAPVGMSYSPDSSTYTTYETAIPWDYIFYANDEHITMSYSDSAEYGIGYELGISVTVLNAESGSSKWRNYLCWGSGITQDQQKSAPKTCVGSNSVTLSSKTVTPSGYDSYDASKLDNVNFTTEGMDDKNTYYDYLANDTSRSNKLTSKDQLTSLTYDKEDDLDYWGGDGAVSGIIVDSGDPAHGKALAYTKDIEQFYLKTACAGVDYFYPLSFTFEFDFQYTGNEVLADGYDSYVCNWFGGSSTAEFECGYYFQDSQFKIVNRNDHSVVIGNPVSYNFEKGQWYNWKFQYDNKSCTARLYINDQLIINTTYRYFYYSSDQSLKQGTPLYFWQMNTQTMYDNVRIYNFVDWENTKTITENGGNNNGGNNSTTIVDKTTDVDTSAAYYSETDGLFHVPVKVKTPYLSAISLSFKLSFDTAKAEFAGISGLDESAYTAEKQADGSYLITIKDFSALKSMKDGDVYFEVLLKSLDGGKDPSALNLKMTDTYRYTVQTGDGMIYIVIAAVVMALGCAVIIVKRKSFVR